MRLGELEIGTEYVFTPGFAYRGGALPSPAGRSAYRVRFEGAALRGDGKRGALVTFVDRSWVIDEPGWRGSSYTVTKAAQGQATVVNQAQILMPWDAYHAQWTVQDRRYQAETAARKQRAERKKQAEQREREQRKARTQALTERLQALGLDCSLTGTLRVSDHGTLNLEVRGDAVLALVDRLETDPQLAQALGAPSAPSRMTVP